MSEQRIKALEMIVNRLSKRSKKTAQAIFTPYPFSSLGELNYLFAGSGIVTKLVARVDNMPKDGVEVLVETYYAEEVSSRTFTIKKALYAEPNIEVGTGDLFKVSISPVNPADDIGDYWIGILWMPNKKEVDFEKVLIDKLDEISNEVLEEE